MLLILKVCSLVMHTGRSVPIGGSLHGRIPASWQAGRPQVGGSMHADSAFLKHALHMRRLMTQEGSMRGRNLLHRRLSTDTLQAANQNKAGRRVLHSPVYLSLERFCQCLHSIRHLGMVTRNVVNLCYVKPHILGSKYPIRSIHA